MICPELEPMTRARSTKARSLSDSVCDRMIRAVDDQLVRPITMTMTSSVMRIPNTSLSDPNISVMTGARTSARTNVGMTRKKSVTRMRSVSVRPPRKPAMIPTLVPTRTVTAVARSPMTIETRAPWTVRLSMLRPSSSVPNGYPGWGGASRGPVAVDAVWSGPTSSVGNSARNVKKTRIPRPSNPPRRWAIWRPDAAQSPHHPAPSFPAQFSRAQDGGAQYLTLGSRNV